MQSLLKSILNSLSIVCFIALSGCTAAIDSASTLPTNNKDGMVAFSVNCTGPGYIKITYSYIPSSFPDFSHFSVADNNGLFFACNTSTPQYQMLKLGAGPYEFMSIYLAGIASTSNDFKPIEFKVISGKVTYLGRFNIESHFIQRKSFSHSDKVGELFLGIDNAANEDIPWLLKRYRNIPASAYSVNIIKQNK